jgi:hypothetical protein
MAQNQCIFEYCNFGDGYLKIFFPAKKNSKEFELVIELTEDYPIVDGVITNIESLAKRIKKELTDAGLLFMPQILLLLRCEETFRHSLPIPVKNSFQAKMLYNKEMKLRPNMDQYYTEVNSYKSVAGNSVRYTYNTYFMPKDIVESFMKLAKFLGTDVGAAKPYGMWLSETLDYDCNYVYFHVRQKVCTMILVVQNHLVTSYDFEFERDSEILNKFLLVASKHEFEFDKQKITHYGESHDEPIQLDLGLQLLGSDKVVEEIAPKQIEKQDDKKALAKSIQHKRDDVEVEWENYDDDPSIFNKRYADSNMIIRKRYDAISKALLNYTGMKCRITENCAIFHINSTVYAKMDIRNSRVMLYLATEPEKYVGEMYTCALTKRAGFEDTPCLYKIATAFRYDGAFELIKDLAAEKGLILKA